jgi:hypothetical protein
MDPHQPPTERSTALMLRQVLLNHIDNWRDAYTLAVGLVGAAKVKMREAGYDTSAFHEHCGYWLLHLVHEYGEPPCRFTGTWDPDEGMNYTTETTAIFLRLGQLFNDAAEAYSLDVLAGSRILVRLLADVLASTDPDLFDLDELIAETVVTSIRDYPMG